MNFARFSTSFADAFRGLKFVFKSEQNFRIQVVAGIAAIVASILFPLKMWEVVLVLLMVLLVWLVEMMNTAIEYFTDMLKPRLHHYVFVVKDIMAGAVFLVSIGAMAIGLMIFLPHFINLFK
ncbi:MAG: diacylglycerol kinase [Patescibacteria group bacterium]